MSRADAPSTIGAVSFYPALKTARAANAELTMTRTTAGPTSLSDQRPIPIPWRVRWQRFRHQLLPGLTLVFCSMLAGWLWYHQAATGHAVNVEEPDLFNRSADDFLTLVDSGRWRPRDPRSYNPSTMARK